MKKLILLLTVFAFALTANVFAQTITGTVDASANIITEVSVTAGNNLQFGDVIAGTAGSITIDASTGNAEAQNSETPQLGTFTLSGSDTEIYTISFDIPSTLTGPGDPLPFSMNGANFGRVDGSDGTNNENGNFNPTSGTTVQFSTSATNDITISLGGEVTPPSGQATGSYTGTVTLELTPGSF